MSNFFYFLVRFFINRSNLQKKIKIWTVVIIFAVIKFIGDYGKNYWLEILNRSVDEQRPYDVFVYSGDDEFWTHNFNSAENLFF